ncbi:MAG TPA: hypothetical protein VFL93_00130 [Longimicrobiaceae bacterium]|nr:hypothetical protein [Longimicrobiaceae bacterium]
MNKLFNGIGAFVGSWAGWAVGAQVSMMTAFVLSTLGMGVGMFAARWLLREYF